MVLRGHDSRCSVEVGGVLGLLSVPYLVSNPGAGAYQSLVFREGAPLIGFSICGCFRSYHNLAHHPSYRMCSHGMEPNIMMDWKIS